MHYQWDFSLVWQNLPVLLKGLGVTLELWLLAGIVGTLIGLAVGVVRARGPRYFYPLTSAFVEVFRNTPVLIQLIWFYYAFPVLVGIQFSTFGAAALALTLYTAAYSTEIFRAGLQSIERGQWEGAKALGMPPGVMLRRMILYSCRSLHCGRSFCHRNAGRYYPGKQARRQALRPQRKSGDPTYQRLVSGLFTAGGVAARRPSPGEKKPAEIARVDSNANPLTANNITITRRYFMMCITKTSPPVRGGC